MSGDKITFKHTRQKTMAMITIVMAYHSRQRQLDITLKSFLQYNPKEFNVVIVDDASPQDIILPELPFEVKVIKLTNKTWKNAAIPYNFGFNYALLSNPGIIIIQNPECCHMGHILESAKTITDGNYISFPCYSQGKGEEPGSSMNHKCATFEGESAWYNHPFHNPRYFHFCSVITAKNLIKLNGFDERFSDGLAYDDDYFVYQIRKLGLVIDIPEYPYVVHQWHYDNPAYPNGGELCENNKNVYDRLVLENNYRAQHRITPDLKWIQK
jgi:glycosyltransferase involved in cell wall biosynthesis